MPFVNTLPIRPTRCLLHMQGVIANARQQLLTVAVDLPFTNATNASIAAMVAQVDASPAEALIFCGLSSESLITAQTINDQKVPLKALVMANGAYSRCAGGTTGTTSHDSGTAHLQDWP